MDWKQLLAYITRRFLHLWSSWSRKTLESNMSGQDFHPHRFVALVFAGRGPGVTTGVFV
jgi:hypothetical protein